MESEEWRPVVEYESLYEISSLGRVRNAKGVVRKLQSASSNSKWRLGWYDYLSIRLCKAGKYQTRFIHRLVARAFLGPRPSPRHQIDHKDGNKHNNVYTNLEWVTSGENQRRWRLRYECVPHYGLDHTQKVYNIRGTTQTVTPIRNTNLTNTPNTLERIRLRIGISRPEMLRVVGAREGRVSPFVCSEAQLDPIFIRRSYEIEQLYEQWKAGILQYVDTFEILSVKELANALGTYEMRLLRMRNMGFFGGDGGNYRMSDVRITPKQVRALFTTNEQYLAQTRNLETSTRMPNKRSPFGAMFLKWVQTKHPSFYKGLPQDITSAVQRAVSENYAAVKVK